MLKTLIWWIFLAFLCCTSIKILLLLDLNKKVHSHFPGQCSRVGGIRRSVTDIALLPDGIAIISSGFDLLILSNASKQIQGRLYSFDIASIQNIIANAPKVKEINLITSDGDAFDSKKFNPVGLSFYQSKGVTNLYVVNRMLAGDVVECFVFDKKLSIAKYMKTIRDAWIYNAEGILAVGPDKFYLTNKHYFRSRILQFLEIIFMLNLGSLIYFDGKSAKVADRRLLTPTGVAADKDKKYLFVSFAIQEVVRVYRINLDGSVVKQADLSLLTSTNRIFADPESDEIWLTASPVLHEFLSFNARKSSGLTSSHVLRVRTQDKEKTQWVISELFANDGSSVNAGYASIYFKGYLLIGGLGGQLLICEAPLID